MAHDYFPDNEPGMLDWSQRFLAQVAVDPQAFGLSVQQVQAGQAATDLFAVELDAARGANRGRIDVIRKNQAKRQLERTIRPLARLVAAQPTLDDVARSQLGLTIAPATSPPVAAPGEAPFLAIRPRGRGAMIHVCNPDGTRRRGRPRGVKGVMIFYAVSDSPWDAPSEWTFIEITTKLRVRVNLPPSVPPGSIVFYNACWLSPTLKRGPMSQSPRSTRVLDGMGGVEQIRKAA